MYKAVAYVTALVLLGCANGEKPSPSFEALDTLLELELEALVQIKTISDPIPVYRKDLSPSYIAYWLFLINNNEQLIVSAGPRTGDYKLVFQGPLPSLTTILDSVAEQGDQRCSKYFMLSPDITLMCEDSMGTVVATTRDSYIQSEVDNTTLLHQFVQDNLDMLGGEWTFRSRTVKTEAVWDDLSFINKEDSKRREDVIHENGGLLILRPGQVVKIPITAESKIQLLAHDHNAQSRLCELLGVCRESNQELADLNLKQQTAFGISYIALSVPLTARGNDIRFDVRIPSSDGLVIKRFYADLNRRVKRRTTFTSWKETSIRDEYLFPDYNQFKQSGCNVGCGPVAWAMILGYFDRRSHDKPGIYGRGSQSLYRCGSDGMTGSAGCRAPARTDSTMRNYLLKVRKEIGTFCLFGQGATRQGHMGRIGNVFKRNQVSGNPTVKIHRGGLLGLVGIYSSKYRNTMIGALKEGWPVVVGIRVGGIFSQHYPVATKYRSRVKSTRRCFIFCWTTKRTEHQMYVHMGWGGSQNGWRNADVFFAGYLKY